MSSSSKSVSTDYYTWEHGRKPRGRGTWAFTRSTHGRFIPVGNYEITWAPADLLYSEAVRWLPAGEWIALP